MQDFVNNNTTADDAGSVNDESNDGLNSDLNTEQLDTPITINVSQGEHKGVCGNCLLIC